MIYSVRINFGRVGRGSAVLQSRAIGDVLPELAGKELILVTERNGADYVVEWEPFPPSQQPTSYVVPLTAVDAARVRRYSFEATAGD